MGKRSSGAEADPVGKQARLPRTIDRRGAGKPDILNMVDESLNGLRRVKAVKTTLLEFDRPKYRAGYSRWP